jgi:hypothetical protein
MDYQKKYLKYLTKYNNLVGGAEPDTDLQTALERSELEFREEQERRRAIADSDAELVRILQQSKLEEEQQQKILQQQQELELQQALRMSEQSIFSLEPYSWYKNDISINNINNDVLRLLNQLIHHKSIFSEYENYENNIIKSIFSKNRRFADPGGPWKGRTLSSEFHDMAIYNSEIMLKHFKNGIIHSGIIDHNQKARGTYITPEQALEETQKFPIIFELNIVTMYIKLLLEENQRQKIWPKLDSPKDKKLWEEIQKLFDPLINLLIKLLKISITLPIFIEPEYGNVDFNLDENIIKLKARGHKILKQIIFINLSSYIRDYIYPAVKYFLLKIPGSQIIELYK